ncbi:hypothetical protein Ndes2526B_g01863 [Nannochloris sp. 'desiccata']
MSAGATSEPPSSREPMDINQAAEKFGWEVDATSRLPDFSGDRQVMELPVAAIRRPLQGVRTNNQEKVEALKQSINKVGLLEPIDVLEVDGKYWGFSGCHRFQAHQELGKETILCRVWKATPAVLKFHMM